MKINDFLLENGLRISDNPCVSPDFCLDWEGLVRDIEAGAGIIEYPKSAFATEAGEWSLLENALGDHAWKCCSASDRLDAGALRGGRTIGDAVYFPASYENLIALKNLVQEFDGQSSIFPVASGDLAKRTLGVGARFTTLHWPAVDWTMAQLGMGVTANQNSIPRELVYDADSMLQGNLDTVPFPFIGTDVPEGHQGQTVEGMAHGCILAKLKTGFHKRGIHWSFNADHQPIGGKFDEREDQLVKGCLFASYITFDLSPELARTQVPADAEVRSEYVSSTIEQELVEAVRHKVAKAGLDVNRSEMDALLCYVWPAMVKMKRRDDKYKRAREKAFTTEVGRSYARELSIDELPGLTTPETTGVMLALSEAMGMPIDFIAPAFGFQKNMPYPDNGELKSLIERQWRVCETFGVSIGFHSGSGKSFENYQVMGEVTGGNLEIKTSGRYTYEMGVALSQSSDSGDRKLWEDWYSFTRDLALQGAFSENEVERSMAREFIQNALDFEKREDRFQTRAECRRILDSLAPNPDHMFWFEYNFLYVLAAEGASSKEVLGDHSPSGYKQRSRFYTISDEGRLRYAKNVAVYLLFLAEATGLASQQSCRAAKDRLASYGDYEAFLAEIGD